MPMEYMNEEARRRAANGGATPCSSSCSSAIEHCFCCGIRFEQSYVDGPRDWPGTIFDATGNWGSTIFDPIPSERPSLLRIRICDSCILQRRDRIEETGSSVA